MMVTDIGELAEESKKLATGGSTYAIASSPKSAFKPIEGTGESNNKMSNPADDYDDDDDDNEPPGLIPKKQNPSLLKRAQEAKLVKKTLETATALLNTAQSINFAKSNKTNNKKSSSSRSTPMHETRCCDCSIDVKCKTNGCDCFKNKRKCANCCSSKCENCNGGEDPAWSGTLGFYEKTLGAQMTCEIAAATSTRHKTRRNSAKICWSVHMSVKCPGLGQRFLIV